MNYSNNNIRTPQPSPSRTGTPPRPPPRPRPRPRRRTGPPPTPPFPPPPSDPEARPDFDFRNHQTILEYPYDFTLDTDHNILEKIRALPDNSLRSKYFIYMDYYLVFRPYEYVGLLLWEDDDGDVDLWGGDERIPKYLIKHFEDIIIERGYKPLQWIEDKSELGQDSWFLGSVEQLLRLVRETASFYYEDNRYFHDFIRITTQNMSNVFSNYVNHITKNVVLTPTEKERRCNKLLEIIDNKITSITGLIDMHSDFLYVNEDWESRNKLLMPDIEMYERQLKILIAQHTFLTKLKDKLSTDKHRILHSVAGGNRKVRKSRKKRRNKRRNRRSNKQHRRSRRKSRRSRKTRRSRKSK